MKSHDAASAGCNSLSCADKHHSLTIDYENFDIFCRQFYFSFPEQFQHYSGTGGRSSRVFLNALLLLKLTFVSSEMVDMQNVEWCTAHALVILAEKGDMKNA